MPTRRRMSLAALMQGSIVFASCAVFAAMGSATASATSTVCPTCTAPVRCIFDGVLNKALGAATLSATPSCNLLVSGIGASGLDGFSQDSLPAGAHEIRTIFTGQNLGASSSGARQVVSFHANVPGGLFATMTVEDLGDSIEVRPDFSAVGATLYTVVVMNGSEVTGVFPNLPNGIVRTGECVEVEVS